LGLGRPNAISSLDGTARKRRHGVRVSAGLLRSEFGLGLEGGEDEKIED